MNKVSDLPLSETSRIARDLDNAELCYACFASEIRVMAYVNLLRTNLAEVKDSPIYQHYFDATKEVALSARQDFLDYSREINLRESRGNWP